MSSGLHRPSQSPPGGLRSPSHGKMFLRIRCEAVSVPFGLWHIFAAKQAEHQQAIPPSALWPPPPPQTRPPRARGKWPGWALPVLRLDWNYMPSGFGFTCPACSRPIRSLMKNHSDIHIGTLVSASAKAPSYFGKFSRTNLKASRSPSGSGTARWMLVN